MRTRAVTGILLRVTAPFGRVFSFLAIAFASKLSEGILFMIDCG